jgi:putative endonuclease
MAGFVYIMTTSNNAILYTGVTSQLLDRINQHKNKKYPKSFTARYNICKLVYYERVDSIESAIKREKQIKGGSRNRKLELINKFNPEWIDLSSGVLE